MKKLLLPIFMVIAVIGANQTYTSAQNPILWGMTSLAGGQGNIFKVTAAGAFTNEYNFNATTDGAYPTGALIKANNGLLYGLTTAGGVNSKGAIFSFDMSTSKETTVHNFGYTNTDGYFPYGSLIQATDGLLYGMAESGGFNNDGIIFSYNITTDTEMVLHQFTYTDGAFPYGALLQAKNGLLYGLTLNGGTNDEGVIFSYNISTGKDTALYNFGSGSTGWEPYGSLIQVNDTLLYGLAWGGGTNENGVIFKFNISTGKETDVYNFSNSPDCDHPKGSLLLASDGLLYGTTSSGGTSDGTIFSYDMSKNKDSVLFNFDIASGDAPRGSLIQASNGLLYGMTNQNGPSVGSVFSYNITTATEAMVHGFNSSDGNTPWGDLIEVGSSGVNQLSVNSNQLSVYPNPTSGAITISSTKNINEVTVTNLVGQVIYTAKPKQTKFTFELKDEGMYFITVTSGSEITTRKIILDK